MALSKNAGYLKIVSFMSRLFSETPIIDTQKKSPKNGGYPNKPSNFRGLQYPTFSDTPHIIVS